MRIIISPAKKMVTDTDSFAIEAFPHFLEYTAQIKSVLKRMNLGQLKALWKCSDSLAEQNARSLAEMNLQKNLTPAIIAYAGIQYQYMAPGIFEQNQLDYIKEHLRILSGFYGVLRPFDGVVPYRLEMQAKLALGGSKDLYHFWGDKLAHCLEEETDFIVNLASKEYSKAIQPYLQNKTKFLTCSFTEMKNGKPVEKATFCKMARGQMVRWMAVNNITTAQGIQAFDESGYKFSEEYSSQSEFVFIKKP